MDPRSQDYMMANIEREILGESVPTSRASWPIVGRHMDLPHPEPDFLVAPARMPPPHREASAYDVWLFFAF